MPGRQVDTVTWNLWHQGWPVFIKRGGPGSGNWGHAGRPGKQGGSAPGGGGRGFEGKAKFGDVPYARAQPGGTVLVNRAEYKEWDSETRRYILAHEVIHQTVEEFILHDMDEWDLADEVLKTGEDRRGMPIFAGWHSSMGESASDAVANYLTGNKFGGVSDERNREIAKWAKGVTGRAGYDATELRGSIQRLQDELDAELEG